jgi:hypothetical protein
MVEVLVTMMIGITVLLGTFALVDSSIRGTARVGARVEANQRARPVMQRILDELHSTCVAPKVKPILAGSTGTSIAFIHSTSRAVSPTPDKHVITLNGDTLTESIYPATSGTAPTWTFATNPSSTRELLTGVGQARLGNPPVAVPIFRYYAYQGGQLSGTELPTPLSATNAGLTSQVTVSMGVSPTTNPVRDPNAAVSVTDSSVMRLAPASEDAGVTNLPCT